MDQAANSSPASKEKKASQGKGFTVGVDADAHRSVEAQAKKLNMSKSKYASAAIAYFATNGLDPCSQETQGLISVQAKMSEVGLEIRKQNVDIGNRLVAILRTWESNQYKFMQQQQVGVLDYLEDIETNILNHQVAVESQLFAPMLERLVRSGVETHMNRVLSEIVLLKLKEAKFSLDELKLSTTDYDGQLDRRLVSEVKKLLETATVAAPKRTQKPVLAVPIVGAPAKPVGTPASPSTTPTAPKS
jgi:hypothetical protein